VTGEEALRSPSPSVGELTAPDAPQEFTPPEVRCRHDRTRIDKSFNGNFITMRTVCESCGRIVGEENVLLGLEHLRCPVDPRLARCLISCPVEDGSLRVFENPCEPVRRAMETYGFVAIMPANPSERESPEKVAIRRSRLQRSRLKLRKP
jgi:hypothetical protein